MVTRRYPALLLLAAVLPGSRVVLAQQSAGPPGARLLLRFDGNAPSPGAWQLHGAKRVEGTFGGAVEFTNSVQHAELTDWSGKLDGVEAASVGVWVLPRRMGE